MDTNNKPELLDRQGGANEITSRLLTAAFPALASEQAAAILKHGNKAACFMPIDFRVKVATEESLEAVRADQEQDIEALAVESLQAALAWLNVYLEAKRSL